MISNEKGKGNVNESIESNNKNLSSQQYQQMKEQKIKGVKEQRL